jgi:hypothetical protein
MSYPDPILTVSRDAGTDGFVTMLHSLQDFTFDVFTKHDVWQGVLVEVLDRGRQVALNVEHFDPDATPSTRYERVAVINAADITEVRFL